MVNGQSQRTLRRGPGGSGSRMVSTSYAFNNACQCVVLALRVKSHHSESVKVNSVESLSSEQSETVSSEQSESVPVKSRTI